MAVVAVVTTRDMCRMLAGRASSVVTGSAGSQDMCVVNNNCWLERERVVAVFANIARLNVCRALARCGDAVVARNAIAVNTGVVEPGRQPARRAVAVVALVIARNMGSGLSGCLYAVVAIDAASG